MNLVKLGVRIGLVCLAHAIIATAIVIILGGWWLGY